MKTERRDKIKVALSEAERTLIEMKMKKYGYRYLSAYIRDACIYENIIYEEMGGKQEVLQAVSIMLESITNLQSQIHSLLSYGHVDQTEAYRLQHQMDQLSEDLRELKLLIIQKLQVTYQKKHLREKIKQESLELEVQENASNT